MRRTILSSLFLAFLIFIDPARSQDAKRIPMPTGICDVVSAPKRYCGKLIKVRSRVESDGIEHTVLLDDELRCHKGVIPWTKKTSDGQDPFAPIDDAIYRRGRFGTIDKKIIATFTGTFLCTKDEEQPRVLEIESVSDVVVSVLPENHSSNK